MIDTKFVTSSVCNANFEFGHCQVCACFFFSEPAPSYGATMMGGAAPASAASVVHKPQRHSHATSASVFSMPTSFSNHHGVAIHDDILPPLTLTTTHKHIANDQVIEDDEMMMMMMMMMRMRMMMMMMMMIMMMMTMMVIM